MSTQQDLRRHIPSRAARGLVLLLLCVLVLRPASARAGEPRTVRSQYDPLARQLMAFTRFAHAARLRASGATITHTPDERLQLAHNDCAIAIVEQLHQQAGRPLPNREWLARALHLTPRGVTLSALAATLTTLGWPAAVERVRFSRAAALHPPAIALMTPGHFVLVSARTATHVEFFDPLVGHVQQPLPPFEARWTGKSVQLSAADN